MFGARGQERIRTSTGLDIGGLVPLPDDLDVLLVPGLMHTSPHDLVERVAGDAAGDGAAPRLHLRGVRIAGTCSGSFLLAESGLLDGHRATCSWWLARAFRAALSRACGSKPTRWWSRTAA